jgi:hypothetical protein
MVGPSFAMVWLLSGCAGGGPKNSPTFCDQTSVAVTLRKTKE